MTRTAGGRGSPAGARPLARGLNPDEGGAHLVCFTAPSGGEVFSAGSITYGTALLCDPPTSAINGASATGRGSRRLRRAIRCRCCACWRMRARIANDWALHLHVCFTSTT